MTISRDYRKSTQIAPLSRKYGRQVAELKMDTNGFVSVCVSATGNLMSVNEWHRRGLTWVIPETLTIAGIDDLINKVLPLLEELHKLHTMRWDGSNWVSHMGTGSEMVYIEIQELINNPGNHWETAEIWPALETFDEEIDTLRAEYREMGNKDKFIKKLITSVKDKKIILADIDDLIEKL